MNDYRAYIEYGYNDIYHHGIQGQKWGKRNGPPYPLNYDWSAYNKKRESGKTGTRKSPKSFSEHADSVLDSAKNKVKNTIQKEKDKIKQKREEKARKKKEKEDFKAARREKYSKLKGTQKFTEFVKDHKKEISVGAAIVAGTILTVYGRKHMNEVKAAVNTKYREIVNKSAVNMFNEYKVKRSVLEAQTGGYGKGKNYQDLMKEFNDAESYIGKRVASMGPNRDSIAVGAQSLQGLVKGGDLNSKIKRFTSNYTFGVLPKIERLEKQLGPDDKRVKNLRNLGEILNDVEMQSFKKVGGNDVTGSSVKWVSRRGFSDEEMDSIFNLFEIEARKIEKQAQREVEEFKSSGKWDSAVEARKRGEEFAEQLYKIGLGDTSMANKNYRNAMTAAIGRGKDYFEDLLMKDVYKEFLRMLEDDILLHHILKGRSWSMKQGLIYIS